MRKRSKHRPKTVAINTVELAIKNACAFTDQERAVVATAMTEALESLRTGTLDTFYWKSLADMLNVAEGLMRQGIGAGLEAHQCIEAASVALAAIAKRMPKSSTARASELEAIRLAADLHKLQLQHCSNREYKLAVEWVRRRVQADLRGDLNAHVVSLEGVAA